MLPEKKCNIVVYTLGITLIVIGFIVGFFWPLVYNYILNSTLALSPSSESYELWKETPMPMYMEIYLFDWINVRAFLKNPDVKPFLRQVGPFVFKEVHKRVDVEWEEDKTVSFNQTRKWEFLPKESLGLAIPVANINVVALTILKMASNHKAFLTALVDFLSIFYHEKIVITKTVNEWLFEGIQDPLLDFAKNFVEVPYDRFGWLYKRNMSSSYDGRFNMKTGEESLYNMGMLNSWNGDEQTDYFKDECAEVKGYTGELFSPLKETDNLTIFVSDFCSPISLKYSETVTKSGINSYHFEGDDRVFDNGHKYPETACFCAGECAPSGARNLTKCRKAPIFVSYPHFYLADQSYLNAVDGLEPEKEEHEFFIDIDPATGLPVEVRAALQLNAHLQPMSQFKMYENVPDIYIPMMWFKQRAEISNELVIKRFIIVYLEYFGVGLACLFAIIGFATVAARACRNKSQPTETRDSSRLLPESEDETTEKPAENTTTDQK